MALWACGSPAKSTGLAGHCLRFNVDVCGGILRYLYPGTTTPQTESTGVEPNGRKGRGRADRDDAAGRDERRFDRRRHLPGAGVLPLAVLRIGGRFVGPLGMVQ
ncbi:hypothetical protein [Streptomyces sp. NPDC020571]|uniref:hypothetical protein n=1 Tax=Streptomyces sp. NPDC020571 TaxID=3365079 RepID=UPI00379CBCC4